MTAMSCKPTPLVLVFLYLTTAMPVTVTKAERESKLNVEKLVKLCPGLHQRVQSTLAKHRKQSREAICKGQLPNFTEDNYVVFDRSDSHAGEKLFLHQRRPRRVCKGLNGYVYQVEDHRNGQLDDIHTSRLKLFRDKAIDKVPIMPHVLQSEKGMVVSRLPSLEDCSNGLHVRIRWKGLGSKEETHEPIARV